ncbi:MAG: 50S ribosomal protein L29 [Actinomycetota bacterium]|nr:50S ribosomal protein L29 [Acidimicrobiales bacterium]MEC8814768.1 50S ribosomal protein L29 [Actinomycetota bacterium]MEC8873038.1 50S ribosomal protein L29 [Actinomycetota bacterium]MEC8982147.1 50S ribosomal protein L29 [Actinomycetota bacterium]MED5167471.1 50S ribosomal protein L29 [Actinomycetota bacterium]|tara:strand:- start:317 stop:553 length:237 start_codon:yes stop_codon:yes gene_type:complete
MAKNRSLTDLGDTDLLERFSDAKEELFNLRFQLVTGQLENYARVGLVKKEIARVLTEIRAREIDAADALEAVNEEVAD